MQAEARESGFFTFRFDTCALLQYTVCPRYNASHYNVDSDITQSIVAPEILPLRIKLLPHIHLGITGSLHK